MSGTRRHFTAEQKAEIVRRHLAKKPDFNQAAEIRSILQELGGGAKFRDVFERLRKKHKGYRFNENSCQQSFFMAKTKLGFTKRRRVRRVIRAKAMASRVGGADGHAEAALIAGLHFVRLAGGVRNAQERLVALKKLIDAAKAIH